MSEDGLITIASRFSVGETIDRLTSVVTSHGMRVFARVDHSANAVEVGMELRPTDLLVFGSPRGGTPLMQDRQTTGIDLPLKALAWEDTDGRVWLTCNDAAWVARRHGLGAGSGEAVRAIAAGLAAVAAAAAGQPGSEPPNPG
jgi:uncharacterized protein (DUF302 family)